MLFIYNKDVFSQSLLNHIAHIHALLIYRMSLQYLVEFCILWPLRQLNIFSPNFEEL